MAGTSPDLLLNGAPAPAALWNRALLYGDGLFETILWRGGGAPLWPWHWRRLSHGCQRLALDLPDQPQVLDECRRLLALCPGDSATVLRLTLFRDNPGTRGYATGGTGRTQRLLSRHPVPAPTSQPLCLGLSSVRLARQPLLAGIKHLNRLEQVLAAAECERQGWDEALMLDQDEQVISAVMGNILLRLGQQETRGLVQSPEWRRADGSDVWVTPALDYCGIAGVTRQWLLEYGPLPLTVRPVPVAELEHLRELWVINSVRGARPAALFNGRELSRSDEGAAAARAIQQKLEQESG